MRSAILTPVILIAGAVFCGAAALTIVIAERIESRRLDRLRRPPTGEAATDVGADQ